MSLIISRPARNITLADPANLAESEHHIYEPNHQGHLPDQVISRVTNAECFGRGPLRLDGKYLAESFVSPPQLERWRKKGGHIRLAMEQWISLTDHIDSPTVWITDNWSCGYFHWFCDALPRLELALKHFDPGDLTLVLPNKFKRFGFFRDTLDLYGLKEVRVLNRFERVICRDLILPHHVAPTGNHDPEIVHLIRNRIGSRLGKNLGAGHDQPKRRVYISREKATRRKIHNEAETVATLRDFGFEKIVAESMSWYEQASLMSETQLLVSIHGSGLTNMIGMPAGESVLEIRDCEYATANCFWSLASATPVNYYYLLADRVDPKKTSHVADVRVNCERLANTIEQMIDGSNRRSNAA